MRVGILGAGQLGKMLAMAGKEIDIECAFFDNVPDACAQGFGRYFLYNDYNFESVMEDFKQYVDIVTFENEHVPPKIADKISPLKPLLPKSNVLSICQNRFKEKSFLESLQIPVPKFQLITTENQLAKAVEDFGLPFIAKTNMGGYDGRGQMLVESIKDIHDCWEKLGSQPLIIEEKINFDMELSIIGVRGTKGQIRFYPLTKNKHKDGILRYSIAPYQFSAKVINLAQEYATKILEKFNYTGVLTLELFLAGNELIANEIAPRVHNSGHWTIEAAKTSQFENHLRAITGMPIGDTSAINSSLMINLIGEIPNLESLLEIGRSSVHLYQKAPRENRKLGHLTYHMVEPDEIEQNLSKLSSLLN